MQSAALVRYCSGDCWSASKEKGLGMNFASIREVDAIVHVVRADDEDVMRREQGREDINCGSTRRY